jgi:hypothetical protein
MAGEERLAVCVGTNECELPGLEGIIRPKTAHYACYFDVFFIVFRAFFGGHLQWGGARWDFIGSFAAVVGEAEKLPASAPSTLKHPTGSQGTP